MLFNISNINVDAIDKDIVFTKTLDGYALQATKIIDANSFSNIKKFSYSDYDLTNKIPIQFNLTIYDNATYDLRITTDSVIEINLDDLKYYNSYTEKNYCYTSEVLSLFGLYGLNSNDSTVIASNLLSMKINTDTNTPFTIVSKSLCTDDYDNLKINLTGTLYEIVDADLPVNNINYGFITDNSYYYLNYVLDNNGCISDIWETTESISSDSTISKEKEVSSVTTFIKAKFYDNYNPVFDSIETEYDVNYNAGIFNSSLIVGSEISPFYKNLPVLRFCITDDFKECPKMLEETADKEKLMAAKNQIANINLPDGIFIYNYVAYISESLVSSKDKSLDIFDIDLKIGQYKETINNYFMNDSKLYFNLDSISDDELIGALIYKDGLFNVEYNFSEYALNHEVITKQIKEESTGDIYNFDSISIHVSLTDLIDFYNKNEEQYTLDSTVDYNCTYYSILPLLYNLCTKSFTVRFTPKDSSSIYTSFYNKDNIFNSALANLSVVENNKVVGDANNDGRCDIIDVITVNRIVLGKDKLDVDVIELIDSNRNGVPDSIDSLQMLKYIVGLIEPEEFYFT